MLTEDCQQALQTVRDVKWEFRVNDDEPPNIVFGDGCVDLPLSMQSVVIDQHVWELPFSVSAKYHVATDADMRRYKLSDIDVNLNKSIGDPQHLQKFLLEKFDGFFAEVMQASDELLRVCREMKLKPENEGYSQERVLKSLSENNQVRPSSWGKLNGGLNLVFSHGWKVLRDTEYERALDVCHECLRNFAKKFQLGEPDELVSIAICTAKKNAPWFKHINPRMSHSFFTQYVRFAYHEQVKTIKKERQLTKDRTIAKPLATDETPSMNMERKELQERVQAALDILSQEDQALAKLILVERISVAEIARGSGESYGNIRARLRKIKAKLIRFLAAND